MISSSKWLLFPLCGLLLLACLHRNPGPSANDSAEIAGLLRNVYRWHDSNQTRLIDFEVTVRDSFQTGLNYASFDSTFRVIRQTNYFSRAFLDNYKRIGDSVNTLLTKANPKYLNEINFSFQDADPWTGFQDEPSQYWDQFKIWDSRQTDTAAALAWTLRNDTTTEKYKVEFIKDSGRWKVSYLQGFDVRSMK